MRSHLVSSSLTLLAAFALAFAAIPNAHAAAALIIRTPNPPRYPVEVEPHLNVGLLGWDYGGTSFGPGVRFSIPVMTPGFVTTIDDSIAIGFGADVVRYSGYTLYCDGTQNGVCRDTGGFWAVYFPVVMQWNFWLTDKWSVFGEPGFAVRHTFTDDFGRNLNRGLFTFYAGGRYHFSERVALTLRAGYPTGFSIGLSIF